MEQTQITSGSDSVTVFLRKLWRYRSLILVFAIRDLKVKYAQTSLGLGWSVVQPLTALVIYVVFFEYLLEMSAGTLPYALHVLSGLLGWNFFTYVVATGSSSIQESSGLIKKIYFPKAILPISKVLVAGVEMLISAVLLVPLMLYYDVSLSVNILLFPVVLLFNASCALMVVYWLGAFAIQKRDLYHLVPFLVYFGIWLTPVFFTTDFLPSKVTFLIDYNPMANVLALWRWSLFGLGKLKIIYGINIIVVTVLCFVGMYVFGRKESAFSDFS